MDPLYGQRSSYPKQNDIDSNWIVVDAKDQILGRLATKVAHHLMGKHLPNFQPGVMVGDQVIILNSTSIKVTGNKMEDKEYRWHTGYFGGLKTRTMQEQYDKEPNRIILNAVKGMLPKNSYGRKLLTRVRVFADDQHGMEAQKPKVVTF